jgi:hypothetical protein
MLSWLASADSDALSQCAPEQTVLDQNAIPVELEPLDFRILTMLFEGTKPTAICAALSLDRPEFDQRTARLAFKDLERRIEKSMVERITGRGDFEPVTAARAEAPQAMKRLIHQSRLERDPKVRLAANQAVLKYGGVEPARKVEITTPDKILEQMTPAELALFAAHRQWPGRFREALRAYLPSSTQKQLAVTVTLDEQEVEGEAVGVTKTAEDDIPASSLPPVDSSGS